MNATLERKTAGEWCASLPDVITSLAFSPKETLVAATDASGELIVVEARSGAALCQVVAHELGALRISWGAALATAGQDGKVKWWNAESGEFLREKEGGAAWVEQLACSPDGKKLASAAGKHLKVWDETGELIFEWSKHASTISAIAWRPDSLGIATACYGEVNLFRLAEPAPYETLAWRGSLISLAWSPNARCIAAGSQEASLRFWRLPFRADEELEMTGYPSKIKHLSWDRTSRFLATGGAGELIMVWDVSGQGPAGRDPKILRGHHMKVTALAFQHDGDLLVSGDRAGRICLWTPSKTNKLRGSFATGAEITALAMTPSSVVSGDAEGRITAWKLPRNF